MLWGNYLGRAPLTQLIEKMLEKVHQTLSVLLSRSDYCGWWLFTQAGTNQTEFTAKHMLRIVRRHSCSSRDLFARRRSTYWKRLRILIFWVRKSENEKCEGGVGFTIKSDLVENLERPAGITDCIMTLWVRLPCGRFLSILSVYASTLQTNEEVNLAFYGALCEAITKIPLEEKFITLGDFNAKIGKDWEIWDSLGCHGIGKINNNGLRVLEICSELKLVICNTFFHHKDKHKYTWFQPRSKQGHLFDYIITQKWDLADVCNINVLCSAECVTDHKLVQGKFKLHIHNKIHMSGVKIPERHDVSKLHDPNIQRTVRYKLDRLGFDGTWDQFKQVYSVGLDSLRLQYNGKKHKDWFDDVTFPV